MRLSRVIVALALLSACRAAPASTDTLGPPPPAAAHRIVTLAPSLTDLVLALGGGSNLVGVTRFDDAPEVRELPRVGGYSDPSAEAIVRLHPDLVLCQPSPGNKGAVERVAQAGVSVQVLKLESLDDVTRAITRIGHLTHRETESNKLTVAIDDARRTAREAAARRPRKIRAAVLFDVDPLVAAGPGSFIHELLTDAGAENVIDAAPQPFPTVPLELLVSRRPDAVLVAPMGSQDSVLPRLAEVLRPRAVQLQSSGILRPGPRVTDALGELTRVFDEIAARPVP